MRFLEAMSQNGVGAYISTFWAVAWGPFVSPVSGDLHIAAAQVALSPRSRARSPHQNAELSSLLAFFVLLDGLGLRDIWVRLLVGVSCPFWGQNGEVAKTESGPRW